MAIQLSVSVLLQRELDKNLTVGVRSCQSALSLPHSPRLEKSRELFGPAYVISTDFGMIKPREPRSSCWESCLRLEAEAEVTEYV